MAETPWLDLPYRSLSKENIRAEAARRGLTFRKLMALYYRHDRERAVHLSLSWCVDREHPEKLFGKARVDQFVGDLTKYLDEKRVKLTVMGNADPHSLDKLRGLKEGQHGGDLQQQLPQQSPGPSKPRKRKRGGNRKLKDARRRERKQRATSAAAPPPPVPSILYEDGTGNEYRFTIARVELVRAAKPPAKRSKKRARRSPSTSSSSSSASSLSPSSSSSSPSSPSSSSSGSNTSFCEWLFAPSSPSESSSPSEDEDLPRAEPSAPAKGDGAVPAAEAASPSPELEVIYSKPPEQVDNDRWTKAFRRALPAEEERESQL
jgi:hypothetical protein